VNCFNEIAARLAPGVGGVKGRGAVRAGQGTDFGAVCVPKVRPHQAFRGTGGECAGIEIPREILRGPVMIEGESILGSGHDWRFSRP
jgi:hypothetical protein